MRVVAATNRDLAAMVQAGSFRADLFYRLAGFVIVLPPLRTRLDDVPALAGQFLRQMRTSYGEKRLASAALQRLQTYQWPGNVRELRNVLERAAILSLQEPEILPAHLGNFDVPLFDSRSSSERIDIGGEPTLDEIERNSHVNSYGPFVVAMPAAAPKKTARGLASRAAYERVARSSSFSTDRREVAATTAPAPQPDRTPFRAARKTDPTPPSEWPSVKMTVHRDGVYFVSATSLAAVVKQSEADVADAITSMQPSIENRGRTCSFIPAEQGLYFYGEAIDEPWATNNVYWIRWTGGRMVSSVGGIFPVPVENTSFTGTVHIEENRYATPALATDPTSDYWYWDYCIAGDPTLGSKSYPIVPLGLSPNAGTAELVAHLQGGSDTASPADHHVTLHVNGTEVGEAAWDGITVMVTTCRFNRALLVHGTNTITITALLDSGAPYSVVYVDAFDLLHPRAYKTEDNQLVLSGDGNPAVSVQGLGSSNIWVLNVADPAEPVSLTGYTVDEYEGAYRVTFAPLRASTRYCVFATTPPPPSPASLTARTPANLRSQSDPVRYIVITTPELAAACQDLADYREASLDRKGQVVLLEDIYDEFADGIANPAAIRLFLAFVAENWGPRSSSPYHVVLCGEGTFDYLDHMGTGDNAIPAMMVPTPYGLCASDGWYADVDEDGTPDMAIGRIPALTHAEMTNQVARIIQYETSEGGEWKQSVLLAADNPDGGGSFHASSDRIGALLPRDYMVSRHHMNPNDGGTTRAGLIAALGRGALILNYFGHGGMDRMAQEGLFRTTDALALTNLNRRPIVVSLSCSLGQFALPGYDCLAEALMLANGGAVAVWAPTTVAYNRESGKLADGLYRAVFRDQEPLLGEAIQSATKSYARDKTAMEVPMIYNLLGDPALQLGGTASLGTDNAFDDWKQELFSDAELGDPDVGSDEADPDGDGRNNFEEYAFGWNPRVADGGDDLIVITRDPSSQPPDNYDVVFRYSRRRDTPDLTFTVESSKDVATWLDEPGVITGTDITDDGNGVSETVSVYVSIPSGRVTNRLFLRLRVSRD
ncbi:MAG: Limonene hydroxylase [Verrucomicrobia bacterium ADurb.Bin345]|nr:MAG: Limonene hydroxylase [Verrucomicrobia bacterium ADurb.Bin345]